MEDDHFRGVSESKSRAQRTFSPLHIFGYINTCKRPNAIEVAAKHRHIASAGITVALDIELETISEDALVSRNCIKLRIVWPPNANIAAENRASWRQGRPF